MQQQGACLLVLDEVASTIGKHGDGGKDASPPFDMTLTLQSIHNGNVGESCGASSRGA